MLYVFQKTQIKLYTVRKKLQPVKSPLCSRFI